MPLSRFPATERDICFKVPKGVTYADLKAIVKMPLAKSSLETYLSPVDIYRREGDVHHTQITIRIKMIAHDHTIDANEANALVDQVAGVAKKLTLKLFKLHQKIVRFSLLIYFGMFITITNR